MHEAQLSRASQLEKAEIEEKTVFMRMIRIAMVVFAEYPQDIRVRREAEALIDAGMSVDVICTRKKKEPKTEKVNNVNIFRIRLNRKRGSKLQYIFQWTYFVLCSLIKLSAMHLFKGYKIIHVHNMPDFLVFSSLIPKLTGSKVILDLHDPMPEVYMTKFSLSESNFMIRSLKLLERFCIKYADMVITTNIAFRDLFVSRSCPSSKINIIMNSPQENIFINEKINLKNNVRSRKENYDIIYHGHVFEMHGLDTALDAINIVREHIPKLMLHVYNDGEFLPEIRKKVISLNLSDIVVFHGKVSIEEIAFAISRVDLGIVPNKMTTFTNINFPTRIFECLIMNKPVIAPRTKGICDYFDENSMFFFEAGDHRDLARQIIKVYSDHKMRKDIIDRGVNIWKQHRWNVQKKYLVNITKHVLDKNMN